MRERILSSFLSSILLLSKFLPFTKKGREAAMYMQDRACERVSALVYLRCAAKKASNKVIDVFGPFARPQCPLRQ